MVQNKEEEIQHPLKQLQKKKETILKIMIVVVVVVVIFVRWVLLMVKLVFVAILYVPCFVVCVRYSVRAIVPAFFCRLGLGPEH